MITFTTYPSGAVLCCSRHDHGAVVVVNRDYDVSAQERANRARKEVERIMMTATDYQIESVGSNIDVVV